MASTERRTLRDFLPNGMHPSSPPPVSGKFSRVRFWLVAFAGASIGEGHVIGRLFDGHLWDASGLILPVLLLLWLRHGSDWARWLLTLLLLLGGAMHLCMSMEMIGIPFSGWSYDYQVAPLVFAIGLYLALAKRDFQRYRWARAGGNPPRNKLSRLSQSSDRA